MSHPVPFTIDVPRAKLDDIRRRVERYPWDTLDDLGDWTLGPPAGFMRRVAAHWLERYDWRAAERELNRFPGFKADVDGIGLHVIHERGSGTRPEPVVLIHGWPSSIYDFYDVIEPLAHPERFGGDPEHGVSVVVPSIAGYGWSGRPRAPQGRRREAAQVHRLMTEVLAYERYVAQGGDFGAMVAAWLAVDHPEAVRGIHVNTLNIRPAGAPWFVTSPPDDFTQEEKEYLVWELGYLQQRMAYAQIQGSSPRTLAYAQLDSPVGQAAWLLEKFHRWTDPESGREPDEQFGMDRLITAVMIYLVTDSFGSSIWAYPGLYTDPSSLEAEQRVEVPVGYAHFADPLVPTPPRSFVERAYNIVHWTDMPRGGHFAAFEQPQLLREDLQTFVALIREREGRTATSERT